MVRHILFLQPRPDATPAQIESCRLALSGLLGQIHGLLDFHWGVNFADPSRQDGYSHGFTMDFIDRSALAAYAPHPLHQTAAKLVRETFGRIAVLDLDI